MATVDFTQQQPEARTLSFAAYCGPFYQLHNAATSADILDHLQARLCQLEALLITTCGNGHESFSSWNDEIQDNFLWACSMMAEECKELAGHIKA